MDTSNQPTGNVLFEPALYQNRVAADEEMIESQSVSTMGGADTIVTNYNKDIDPSLLTTQYIRCCMCGVMMAPNASNTCINCLKSQIDITEGIAKSLIVYHCRECNRYQRPPWQHLELESPELLSLCLKLIKGLKRVKLVDAGFVWTEPHSRRIKVKLTVQKEVMNNTLLQQSFVVEFVVTNLQCEDCKKTYTPHTWVAQLQVRQRVTHKRTFLFLEQLILKHNAADKCINIKEVSDGLDFHFKNKGNSSRLVDFIQNQVPCQVKESKQLISHSEQTNVYNYKFTIALTIAPICKDDLVLLSKSLSKELGGIGPFVLVYKISTFVNIVDVFTMRTYEIDQVTYWKHQFTALCDRSRLSEFIVLNIENTDFDLNVSRAAAKQKFKMVQVEVARKSDFGKNDKTFIVNTHLGEILNFNDTVLGYDLDAINLEEIEQMETNNKAVPEVVLVRKTYPRYRKRQKHRLWKLKHLQKEEQDENNIHKKKDQGGKKEKDYQMFLQDIEEDPEIRQQVDLYKNDDIIAELEKRIAGLDIEDSKDSQTLKDLVAKKTGLEERKFTKVVRQTQEGKAQQKTSQDSKKKNENIQKAILKQKAAGGEDEDGWESVEEDYPHIQLEELLDNLKIDEGKKEGDSEEEDNKE